MVSVAIDGPAGAGKSTLARRLAAELGYIYGKQTDTTETYEGGSGSQTDTIGVDCILCEDIDAIDRAVITSGYATGEFNSGAIILPAEKHVETHEQELRKLGLYIKTVQEY